MKMRKNLTPLVLLLILLGLSSFGLATEGWTLQVQFAGTQAQFSLEELKALPSVEIKRLDEVWQGVSIRTVLSQAGADIGKLEWVEPWGADGYHKRYDRLTSKEFTTILAYEKDGQPLSAEEGPLRSVYPNAHGKMMVRQVDKLMAKLGTWRLTLVSDEQEKEFTLGELKKLPNQEIILGEHAYKGAPLQALLTANEIDLTAVQTLSAVASAGTSVKYKPEELTESSLLLAYEKDGQPLPEGLGTVALISQDEVQVKRLERVVVTLRAEGD